MQTVLASLNNTLVSLNSTLVRLNSTLVSLLFAWVPCGQLNYIGKKDFLLVWFAWLASHVSHSG